MAFKKNKKIKNNIKNPKPYCGLQIKKDTYPKKLFAKNAFKNPNKHLSHLETHNIRGFLGLRKSVYLPPKTMFLRVSVFFYLQTTIFVNKVIKD